DYDSALEGTLVLSSYPLFSANELWTEPRQKQSGKQPTKRLLFSSERSQGVFNATIATLLRLPARQNKSAIHPIEYAVPSWAPRARTGCSGAETIPPLWISVIGHGGFWPLRYFEVLVGKPDRPSASKILAVHTSGLLYGHATAIGGTDDAPAKPDGVIRIAAIESSNGTTIVGDDAHEGPPQNEADGPIPTAADARSMGAFGFSDGIYLLWCLLSILQVGICCFVRWSGTYGTSRDLSGLFRLSACRRCRLGQHALVIGSFYALFAVHAA